MATGPCLCGDPYCGSCGNPELARIEDAAVGFADVLSKMDCSVEEYEYLGTIVPVLVNAMRNALSRLERERGYVQDFDDDFEPPTVNNEVV